MVEPGVVPMAKCRTDTASEDDDPYAYAQFAGVGTKA